MFQTRKFTNALIDALDAGYISDRKVVEMCLAYMAESEVADMCRINDLDEIINLVTGEHVEFDDD